MGLKRYNSSPNDEGVVGELKNSNKVNLVNFCMAPTRHLFTNVVRCATYARKFVDFYRKIDVRIKGREVAE